MRVFIYVWMIVQLVLLVIGGVWTFIDRKNEPRKKIGKSFGDMVHVTFCEQK